MSQTLESTPKKDKMAGILLERDMLIELKQVAAAQHYKSMSEMVRFMMRRYIEDFKKERVRE